MGVDAGTVYAEIRVALDKLQHDVNEANLLFVDLGKNVDKQNQQTASSTQSMAKKISSAFQSMSKNGINQFSRLAQGINSAFMVLPNLHSEIFAD